VVAHDLEFITAADYLVDIGRGQVSMVVRLWLREPRNGAKSGFTYRAYLSGMQPVHYPNADLPDGKARTIYNARHHNLKN
jgi:excinuclease UvrABC ATPase subunit